jgi:hypothetical protein
MNVFHGIWAWLISIGGFSALVALVKNLSTVICWLLARYRWLVGIFHLKRENALLISENQRLITKNEGLVQKNTLLIQENQELRQTLMTERAQKLEDSEKREGWESYTTARGSVVYRKTVQENGAQTTIYACCACFENGKITRLQRTSDGLYLICHEHGSFESDKPFPNVSSRAKRFLA